MNAEELNLSMNAVIGLVTGVMGAVGFWYKLKGTVNLMEQKIETLEDAEGHLHNRIDRLKEEVGKNREKSDNSVQEIKSEMSQMELRIIQAIHEINK